MTSAIRREIARLVLDHRWGALATRSGEGPLASMVAYAPEPGLSGLLLFVSQLAKHTRDLLADPHVSLAVSAPDRGEGDPQLLPRVSLQGTATEVPRDEEGFAEAASRYVARFPDAEMRLELADFTLVRIVVDGVRYVGGFARAVSLTGDELREAARAVEAGD